jgi:hypothetical protein
VKEDRKKKFPWVSDEEEDEGRTTSEAKKIN